MPIPLRWSLLPLLAASLCAKPETPPALAEIRTADLKSDLYAHAAAHFNGRSAGTLDELKAAAWIAEKYRALGLKPAGDDGTYLQFFTLWRNQLSERSSITLNGTPLALWTDVAVSQLAHVTLDAPIVYLGNAADVDLSTADVAGKIVALEANPKDFNPAISLPTWRYPRTIQTKYGLPLTRRGALAVIFVADEMGEKSWADATENYKRGLYDLEGGPSAEITVTAPMLWLRAAAKPLLQDGQAKLRAQLIVSRTTYPSVNIIGVVPGTDPKLAHEYLLYSGHTDAHGLRNPINGDSTYYGADDNGSVNVALFANARAFVKKPAKRSVLFVIHGAEERGLLGSKHFSTHPTVPLPAIVAVLNGDMIGRNDPKRAALLGVIPPHRSSAELVELALAANREGPGFDLDHSWDEVAHPEGWFFRSDHLPYARLGIPALMYTTLLHPDYHTPQDNAENIDYPKLTKMTEWMYRTGWKVANAQKRPAPEPKFQLER